MNREVEDDVPLASVNKEVKDDVQLSSMNREVGNEVSFASINKEMEGDAQPTSMNREVEDEVPLAKMNRKVENDVPLTSMNREVEGDVPLISMNGEVEDDVPLTSMNREIENGVQVTSIIREVSDDAVLASMNIEVEDDETVRDSLLLHQLCCDVGFSQQQWQRRLRVRDIRSTCCSFSSVETQATIYSGSAADGVCADFLGSDVDAMLLPSYIRVIEAGPVSDDEENHVFQMVPTEHPAYVRLQLVHIGPTQTSPAIGIMGVCMRDEAGRDCLLNDCTKPDLREGDTVHGPAVTGNTSDTKEMDRVLSLHCSFWPRVSAEWVDRRRPYNWPSPDTIREIAGSGCEVVAVGHPKSDTPHLEWRLSSSLAEKMLVRSFNVCQIQCYFLLKLVLVFLIKPLAPHTLCSYHMKTVMLHMVETTDPAEWTARNLTRCFMRCLQFLITCLEQGNLPQYFIVQRNLFDLRVEGESRRRVLGIVKELRDEGWRCVLRCPPLNNGNLPCQHVLPRCPCYVSHWREKVRKSCTEMLHFISFCFISNLVTIMNHFQSAVDTRRMRTLLTLLNPIRLGHDSERFPCRDTLRYLQLHTKQITGYSLLAVLSDENAQNQMFLNPVLEVARRFLEEGSDTDVTSGRLKLATFYYQTGDKQRCLTVVRDVLARYTTNTLPMWLDVERLESGIEQEYHQKVPYIASLGTDIHTVLRHVACPVTFPRPDVTCSPPAIHYLMHARRLVTEKDRKHSDVLVIDPLVYVCYLLVVCYQDLGQHGKSQQTLGLMTGLVQNHKQHNLFFPDIARLLLDYCHDYTAGSNL